MLLFWIAIIVLVVAIILEIIAAFSDWEVWNEIFGPLLIIFSLLFACGSAVGVFDKENVEKFEHEYSITLKKINQYSIETDFELLNELYEDCKDIDNTINKNLKLCNSIWRGNAYSEEIGLTPPITDIFIEKFNKAEL